MTIDEIKRQMFIDSEEVCGNTMIDTYQAQEYVEQAYNKAIDDFVNKINESNQGHWRPTRYEHGEVVSETMSYDIGTIRLIAEQLKAGGENGKKKYIELS